MDSETDTIPFSPTTFFNETEYVDTDTNKQDHSPKLLFTNEDEIQLLQGFLDYTKTHNHDTSAFCDHIKPKFQLHFNKNQLLDKLRRVKKKYRNKLAASSGKDYVFKSRHDRATFDISSKLWAILRHVDTNHNFKRKMETMGSVIEETVKSCLSPIFKELLSNVNLSGNGSNLCPVASLGLNRDEKWRKQRILELEVFSKRLELMQEEVNDRLRELRSMDN